MYMLEDIFGTLLSVLKINEVLFYIVIVGGE